MKRLERDTTFEIRFEVPRAQNSDRSNSHTRYICTYKCVSLLTQYRLNFWSDFQQIWFGYFFGDHLKDYQSKTLLISFIG